MRLPFTPEEIVEIGEAVEEEERALAKTRQREHGGTAPGKHSGKISTSDSGKVRDKIGASVGISGRTYEKQKAGNRSRPSGL